MLRDWSDHPGEQGRSATLKLFDELARLTSRVAEVETELAELGGARLRAVPDLARLMLKGRRERDKMFPHLFGEPAWDILLSLAALPSHRPHLAASSVSFEAGVPQTTTLRYLAMLEAAGLVKRSKHPDDGRIVLLRLTDAGRERVQQLFDKWPLAVVIASIAPLAFLIRHFF